MNNSIQITVSDTFSVFYDTVKDMQKNYKSGRISAAESLSRLLQEEIDELMRSGSELEVTSVDTGFNEK